MGVIFNVPIDTVIIFAGIIVVFYSVSGGSWSVQITDTLQAYILVPIALLVFFLAMNEIGWLPGLFDAIEKRPELAKDWQVIMPVGHKYSSPVGNVGRGYFSWWWLIASFIYSFALSANVTSCWRFLSCKTDGDARKAALLAGCLLFFGSAIWYIPGMVARLKYEDEVIALAKPKAPDAEAKDAEAPPADAAKKLEGVPAAPAVAADAAKDVRAADNVALAATTDAEKRAVAEKLKDLKDNAPATGGGEKANPATGPPAREKLYLSNPAEGAYAVLAKKLLPPGLIGLVVIALFAATMSSLDSSLTGNAGIVCNNIYPALMRLFGKEPWTGKKLLRFTQLVNLLLGAWAITLAFLVKEGARDSGIYEVSMNIMALVSLPMVLAMVLSFFVKNLPMWAPLVGMFFGFLGSASFMFSGKVAGWAADVSWMPSMLSAGMDSFAGWIGGLMWHDKVYINLGLTVIPTFACTAWWHRASPEYRARVDAFFEQIRTPVDFEKEVGGAVDHSLMKMIGTLGLVMAGAISILAFFAKNEQGQYTVAGLLSVLFVVGFVATISAMMLILGIRSERKLKLGLGSDVGSCPAEKPGDD